MKLAFPTEDGTTISRHLGRAPYFVVITLDEGEPIETEQREKAQHAGHESHVYETDRSNRPILLREQAPEGLATDHQPGGHDHQGMFRAIADCQVLIAGGMGQPAYEGALRQGLEVFLTGERTIETALASYRSGTFTSDMRRVHSH